MREILFRGKRWAGGKWIYGSYVQQYGATMIYPPDGIDSKHDFDDYRVDPETVGQFTGLTDKNSVRIFEGDIIRHEGECGLVGYNYDYGMFEVDFNYCFVDFSDISTSKCEVIGNIHDNPELMEVRE